MNRLFREHASGAETAPKEALTVTEFTRRVKRLLEGGIEPCWVRGEISNLRCQASGHVYFTLKDSGGQLSCVLFRGDAKRQDFAPTDGMQVIVYGEISVYEPRGNYQLICRMVVDDGLGRLQREFEALKAKLRAEGLFDEALKRQIPTWPAVVGFVTSPSGAAIRDFIGILRRRQWKGCVRVFPARVQGAGAAEEIAAMIRLADQSRTVDLLVVGRGGGSLEDLWPFNEEAVVRAIAACQTPVISAVGHEIDVTLSDFAADVRAETPSAAAELISSGYLECLERLRASAADLTREFSQGVRRRGRDIEHVAHRLRRVQPRRGLEQAAQNLDDCATRLQAQARAQLAAKREAIYYAREALRAHAPQARLHIGKAGLDALQSRWQRNARQYLRDRRENVNQLAHRLQSGSLPNILKRGFAIVRDANGRVVSRKSGLSNGQALALDFADGEVRVRVEPPPDTAQPGDI